MSFSLIYFVCSIDYFKIISAYIYMYIYFYIPLFIYLGLSWLSFLSQYFYPNKRLFMLRKGFFRFITSHVVVTNLRGVPDDRKLFFFCENAFNNRLPGTTTALITTFLPVIGRRVRNDKFPLLIFLFHTTYFCCR